MFIIVCSRQSLAEISPPLLVDGTSCAFVPPCWPASINSVDRFLLPAVPSPPPPPHLPTYTWQECECMNITVRCAPILTLSLARLAHSLTHSQTILPLLLLLLLLIHTQAMHGFRGTHACVLWSAFLAARRTCQLAIAADGRQLSFSRSED